MLNEWFCLLNTSCPKKCYVQSVVLLTKYVMPKEVLCSECGSACKIHHAQRSGMFTASFCLLNTSCPKKRYVHSVVLFTKYIMSKEAVCSQRSSVYLIRHAQRSVVFRVWFTTSSPRKCYVQSVVLYTKYVMPKDESCS